MNGSLVTFLANARRSDNIQPHDRHPEASERGNSEERGAKKRVGRRSSPLIITITTTIIIIINTRNEGPHSSPSSLPYRRSNAKELGKERECYQIFPSHSPLHPSETRREKT
jgi:hypothetical protein